MNELVHNNPAPNIRARRLYFETFGTGAIWFVIELVNIAVAWWACEGGPAGTPALSPTGLRILLGVLTFASLAGAVIIGIMAFRDWRTLSHERDFVESGAHGRREFMTYVGVFVSASLGIGIFWFVLPICILGVCVRPH